MMNMLRKVFEICCLNYQRLRDDLRRPENDSLEGVLATLWLLHEKSLASVEDREIIMNLIITIESLPPNNELFDTVIKMNIMFIRNKLMDMLTALEQQKRIYYFLGASTAITSAILIIFKERVANFVHNNITYNNSPINHGTGQSVQSNNNGIVNGGGNVRSDEIYQPADNKYTIIKYVAGRISDYFWGVK